MQRKEIVISIIKQTVFIGAIAFALIAIAVYAIPHLPLSNKRTFHTMLHTQMTFDREKEVTESGEKKDHLLFLGSSVVERGVEDVYIDSLLTKEGLGIYSTNSGAGGFFGKANLVMFRAMLDRGLRPSKVIYGIFLQELNGKSAIHSNVSDEDTASLRLKKKTLWNVLRYGAMALSPMLDPSSFHIYLFALNNAFRSVHDPNFFQRLSFGENLFERDSTYSLNPEFLKDLKGIYYLCKEKNIPFAFFNTPVRPKVESLADLPYLHRQEAYNAVEQFAVDENIPIWNFDKPGSFETEDFQDTYHLTSNGARKMTKMLADKISVWNNGFIEQDVTVGSLNSNAAKIQDSLIRTVFHF